MVDDSDNSPLTDENFDSELDELNIDIIDDYLEDFDDEQNKRVQHEEEEIDRLWKAKNTLLTELNPSQIKKQENSFISNVDSDQDHNQSIFLQNITKVEVVSIFLLENIVQHRFFPE